MHFPVLGQVGEFVQFSAEVSSVLQSLLLCGPCTEWTFSGWWIAFIFYILLQYQGFSLFSELDCTVSLCLDDSMVITAKCLEHKYFGCYFVGFFLPSTAYSGTQTSCNENKSVTSAYPQFVIPKFQCYWNICPFWKSCQ